MTKTYNNKAWYFVLPVLVLVAFNAIIPLMTVVNYAFQETFNNNVFTWQGTKWFENILRSERFYAAFGRQLLYTFIILLIQIPLGIFIALSMPRKGIGVTICLSPHVHAVINSMECGWSNVEYICSYQKLDFLVTT